MGQGAAYPRSMELTRRGALRVGVRAVGAIVLAGCTAAPTPSSGTLGSEGALTSTHWPGASPRWRLVRPDPGVVPSPRLVVALHGKGGSVGDASFLGLFDQVSRLGVAVAAVDCGGTYFHARRDGSDVGAMVIEDLLPVLRTQGVSPAPVGLLGWSMGGYGALWLAARYGRDVIGAVGCMSSALWTSPGASAPGAFDDRADFVAHDVFARTKAFAGRPLRLDCGTSDPFIAANRAFAKLVPDAVVTFDAGGHNDTYWRAHGIRQLEWFAQNLPAVSPT